MLEETKYSEYCPLKRILKSHCKGIAWLELTQAVP